MTKTVYSPDMVAHLWANGRTEYARNAGSTFYTQDGAIYSYGSHFVIAAFLKNKAGEQILFWNDAGYSNSTARHKSHAVRALSHAQWNDALRVPTLKRDTLNDPAELARQLIRSACEFLEKSAKARTNRDCLIAQARERLNDARRLHAWANIAIEVPTLHDDSKAGVLAFLGLAMRSEYLIEAKALTERAERASADLERSYGSARYMVQRAEQTLRAFEKLAAKLKQAGKTLPRRLANLRKVAAGVKAAHADAAAAEQLAEATEKARAFTMRKADYQTLAELIAAERRRFDRPDIARGLENVARAFAARASVDRVAFLRACGVMPALPHGCPQGSYPSPTRGAMYVATGDKRPPRRDEWYLSGAIVQAWRAPSDLTSPYWIARPID